jgi:hypothetical protein
MFARIKNYYSAGSFLPVSWITPDSRKKTINCFLMIALFCVVKTKAYPRPLSFSASSSLGYISQELNTGLLQARIL